MIKSDWHSLLDQLESASQQLAKAQEWRDAIRNKLNEAVYQLDKQKGA